LPILADIGQVVEDDEVEAVETVDGSLECEFASRHLEPLDEIGGAVMTRPAAITTDGAVLLEIAPSPGGCPRRIPLILTVVLLRS
jgi:hypothetical protein